MWVVLQGGTCCEEKPVIVCSYESQHLIKHLAFLFPSPFFIIIAHVNCELMARILELAKDAPVR